MTVHLKRQFEPHDADGARPDCPVCGQPVAIYHSVTTRGRRTKRGRHRPGEVRTRHEWRKTCGARRCQAVLRARAILERNT